MSSKELDLNFIRKQFPAFSHSQTAEWAFFENAGGSFMAKPVIDKFHDYISNYRVQPYHNHDLAQKAGAAMDKSYTRLAELHNVKPSEIILGPSTSMNTYVLANAFAKELTANDEIIVSNQEHEANAGSWWRLKETGVTIKEWLVNPETGLLDVADLDNLLSSKTKFVFMTHSSNIAAAINDVKTVATKAHSVGAKLLVDGVSYAPHRIIDFKDLGVDYYLYSLYKTYGPHLGLLYIREELLKEIDNQGHFFNKDKLRYKLDPAGPNHAAIAAASGIVDYYETVYDQHFEQDVKLFQKAKLLNRLFAKQEERISGIILDFLQNENSIRIVGPAGSDMKKRVPTISFLSSKMSSADIVDELSKRKVAAGNGHFYAYRLLKALGIDLEDGVVRLSAVHYNSEAEAGRAAKALSDILQ